MFMRKPLLIATLMMMAGPVSATTLVLHSGSGHECYIQTLLEANPSNNRRALDICDEAVLETANDGESYNHAAALVNRADIRLRTEDYEGVVADSRAAVAVYRDLAQAYLNLGAGMIGLKHYQESLPFLDKAIELNGGDPERAYFNRGLAKENLGDIRGAYYDYRKALEINPDFKPANEQLTRFKIITTPDT